MTLTFVQCFLRLLFSLGDFFSLIVHLLIFSSLRNATYGPFTFYPFHVWKTCQALSVCDLIRLFIILRLCYNKASINFWTVYVLWRCYNDRGNDIVNLFFSGESILYLTDKKFNSCEAFSFLAWEFSILLRFKRSVANVIFMGSYHYSCVQFTTWKLLKHITNPFF